MTQVFPLIKGFSRGDGLQTQRVQCYLVQGETDDDRAVMAAMAAAPEYFSALNGYPIPINQVDIQEQISDDLYVVRITYGSQNNAQQQKPVTTFDTGGGSQKITQSIRTVASYGAPGRPIPNFNGAIGVTDNDIEGVDLPLPTQKWNEKHYIPDSAVTQQWLDNLTLLSQTTNDAPFRGRDIDVVKFDHASGNMSGEDLWEFTFYFEAGIHREDLVIGDITGIAKKAWDYLWIRYKKNVDANSFVQIPQFVYVEQVFYQGDFSLLGIPTGLKI